MKQNNGRIRSTFDLIKAHWLIQELSSCDHKAIDANKLVQSKMGGRPIFFFQKAALLAKKFYKYGYILFFIFLVKGYNDMPPK